MTTALVTGANGHIGSHVLRAVADAGWTPVGFVRPASDRRPLWGVDAELREGDILDPATLVPAFDGIDVVFHVAGSHRNFAPQPTSITDPTVEGTRNVLAAARTVGVRRVVHTSSGATIGFAEDPAKPLDEGSALVTPAGVYTKAKVFAEQVALNAAARGQDVVVVNPSGVLGPWDYRLTPATRALIGLVQGDPAFLALTLTGVEDVATGHVAAARRGESGQRYLLTGDVLPPAQLSSLLGDVTGIAPTNLLPPKWMLRSVASRAEARAARDGTDAPITKGVVDDVWGRHLAYDSTKARTRLGVVFRSARDVLVDTFRWLLYIDALRPKVAATVAATLGDRAGPAPTWVRDASLPAVPGPMR